MNKLYKARIILFAAIFCTNIAMAQITSVAFGTANMNTGTNLVANGSFENTTGSWTGYWGPTTNFTPILGIPNWTAIGGGINTYASIADNYVPPIPTEPLPPQAFKMISFGNGLVISDVAPIFNPTTGEVSFATNPTFTPDAAGFGAINQGVSIEQNISGLTIGNTYRLEMYVTGKSILNPTTTFYSQDGIFKIEIVDGANNYNKFLAVPSYNSPHGYANAANPFMRYYINFKPTTTNVTLKFTSFGYVNYSWPVTGTELFMDDVSLNNLGNILPLQLTSFVAALHTNNDVQLNWETADELNVKNIEVQRSTDAINFNTIAMVNAQNKLQNSYIFNDKIYGNALFYYRLKIVDNDGSFKYSKLQAVKNKILKNSAYILENPVKDNITLVNLSLKKCMLSLLNGNGMEISRKAYNNISSTQLDISTLSSGLYFLKIVSPESNETLKFIKQ